MGAKKFRKKKEGIREGKKTRGSKRERESERKNGASSFPRSWQRPREPKGLGVPKKTQPGRGPPLLLPGAGGGARAGAGLLLGASAESFSNRCLLSRSSGRGGRTCVRVPARWVSRVSGGSGVALGGGGGATRRGAELVRSSRSSAGPLPEGSSPSAPSAPAPAAPSFRRRCRAPRRVSAAQRGVALGRRSLGGAGGGASRLGAPRAASSRPWSSPRALPPPPARAACPQSRPPAAPCAGPAAEPGPLARPVRDGEPGRLSRRSARPPRGGRSRSRRRAAALEWRCPAAAIPETGLGKVPTRTPGPPAPLHPAQARARPLGIRSASCAFASAFSTRFWAPRGTTWAPCAFCSR